MPIFNSVTRLVAKPAPRMLSPKIHFIADYIIAGSFLAGAGWFWHRNKRAAVAALVCGIAELAVGFLTDYPDEARKPIGLHAHRELDLGMAAMAATMPKFLGFKDEPERKFFLAHGVLITAIAEVTRFPKAAKHFEESEPFEEPERFEERNSRRLRTA